MHVFYQARKEKYFGNITVNNCYPPHLHREIELFYVIVGQIQLILDGTEYILNEGDFSFCFPNQVHQIKSIGHTRAQLSIFSPDFLSMYETEFLNYHPMKPVIYRHELSKECTMLITSLMNYNSDCCDLRIAHGYLTALTGILLESLHLVSNNSSTYPNSLHLLLSYINSHFTEQISLASISKELGMSTYYISHLFSDKIKTSFTSYLNQQRVGLALQLLKNPELSVTEVCYRSGFNSTRTFFRVFRDLVKITPLQYRKTH